MSDGPDAPPGREGGTERADREPRRSSGNHTEGVAVADLIAKLTGEQRINPRNRRSADVTPPADDLTVPLPVGALPPGARSSGAGAPPRTGGHARLQLTRRLAGS